MVIFSELMIGFSYFKVLLDISEKGKFDGTSKKFGLSITIELCEVFLVAAKVFLRELCEPSEINHDVLFSITNNENKQPEQL
jgi:hypothetical protein